MKNVAVAVLLTRVQTNGMHTVPHIILGLNVPDYPLSSFQNSHRALPGNKLSAFDPLHFPAQDSGKKPVLCVYGYDKE